MDAEHLGDLDHRHRLEVRRPLLEPLALAREHDLHDAHERGVALLDRLDHAARGAHALGDERARLRVEVDLLEHRLVVARHAHARHELLGEARGVVARLGVVLDDDIGDDRGRLRRHEFAARVRIEPLEARAGAVDAVVRPARLLADLRDAVAEKVVVVAVEELDRVGPGLGAVQVGLLVELAARLDEKRLAHAATADALGLDLLLETQKRGLKRGERPVAAGKARALLAHRLERGRHQSVVVDVLDEPRAGDAHCGVDDSCETPLFLQFLGEAAATRGRIGHRVHLRVAVAVVAHRAAAVELGVPLVAVLPLEPAQALELGGAVAVGRLAAALGALAELVAAARHHEFKRDILLDFLLEPLGELHRVELQDLRRLNQLRRQTHGLAELHALRGFETHSCHRERILRRLRA